MAATTLQQLSIQFEQAKKEITQTAEAIVKTAATEVYESIVKKSPICTGSYVLSHRIGINFENSSPPTRVNQELQNICIQDEAVKHLLRQQAMMAMSIIKTAQHVQSIIVSNAIEHAIDVEYIGWPVTPAYHVYGLTYLEIKQRLPEILRLAAAAAVTEML